VRASVELPNFLILGAAKSGTTSLYYYVGQHPDVCLSQPKEPLFFESEYERGLGFYWERYFGQCNGQSAIGEARVYNLYLPYVPQRIRDSLPHARFIAVLRDPVDRAYSHWWHRYTRRIERLSFEDAVADNLETLRAGPRFEGDAGALEWQRGLFRNMNGTRYRTYVDLGYYAEQLGRYLELFPRERLKVILYEELVSDPAAVARDVWGFLGVDPEVELEDLRAQNVANPSLTPWYERALLRAYKASNLGVVLPASWKLRARAAEAALRDWLEEDPIDRPPLAAETRRDLGEHFAAHNETLAALLGRDLSHWSRSD